MDTMTIIYIVVAFVVGAILTSIFKKGSNSTSSDNAKMQELEAENGSLKEKLSSISNESRNKESQLKEKYESLLSEAQNSATVWTSNSKVLSMETLMSLSRSNWGK
jgi:hypothetical protein